VAPRLGVAPVRREEIVQATIRCLARDGYSGLRMKEVARAAGVSQGILHYLEEAGSVILALVDGISLQRTFDPKALTLARATRVCEEAALRFLERGR
jgi:AcrR family transcriptional regulator